MAVTGDRRGLSTGIWVGHGKCGALDRILEAEALSSAVMSKRTSKRRAKARRSKANHGRKPNCGRNS